MIEPIRIELSLEIMFPSVNCYFVPGDIPTLIDCGVDSDENWNTLQRTIGEHGYEISDIGQVIITHEHRDHIGLLPRMLQNSDAEVFAPKMIEGWFSRPEELRISYVQFLEKLLKTIGFPKEKMRQCIAFLQLLRRFPTINEMNRFSFFEEGDFLNFGNKEWEVLNTPGHCPSQHVFLQKEEKKLVSSDMLLPVAPMPIVNEDPNRSGQPVRALKQLLESFTRLKNLNFENIYPGHGPEFSEPKKVIERQLARIGIRKNECLEAVRSGLKTAFQINRKMYPYQMIPPDFSGMYMVLGYLDLLEEEGSVSKRLDENGVLNFYSIR